MTDFEHELRQTLVDRGDPTLGFFGPGSASWRMNADAVTYLGGVRALLLQVAHPKVAQGVADHSNFESDPLARLRGTFRTVHAIVFGDREKAIAASVSLHRMHDSITGRLSEPSIYFDDPEYSANDPELQRWVWATLVDSAMYVHRLLLPEKPSGFWRQFYEESKLFAEILGLPLPSLPPRLGDFYLWVSRTLNAPVLGSTETSRRVAAAVVRGPALLRGTRPVIHGLAGGMLPETLVRRLGLRWNTTTKVTYRASILAARTLVAGLSEPRRALPIARRAKRRHSRFASAKECRP